MKSVRFMQTLFIALAIVFWIGVAPSMAETTMKIQADVTGILYYEPSHGYFISANPNAGPTDRVWLSISENKVLLRDLEKLKGQFVEAKGLLEQIHPLTKAVFAPYSMYLSDFSIETAKKQNRN